VTIDTLRLDRAVAVIQRRRKGAVVRDPEERFVSERDPPRVDQLRVGVVCQPGLVGDQVVYDEELALDRAVVVVVVVASGQAGDGQVRR